MVLEAHGKLTLDEIRAEVLDCETAEERLGYLIEIGNTLAPFPLELCTEENRVLGCQSMVWLVAEQFDDRIRFHATSDAPMVRGLIAILIAAYSNRSPQDILQFPIEGFFRDIALSTFITPMRSNGLHSMIKRVHSIARSRLEDHSSTVVSPTFSSKQRPVRTASRTLEQARSDFPILDRRHPSGKRLVYLDSAASSQRPRQVIDEMSKAYREFYSNVHRSGHSLAAESTMAMERARRSIARFIDVPNWENEEGLRSLIFTSGTTASINLVARAWGDANVKEGNEILLTEMEHHSNIVPWQQLAARTGAVIRWLPIRDDYQLDIEQLSKFISKKTKIVAVTAVSNVLGTLNPISAIVEAVHQAGSLVLVDAAQAAPHADVDVQEMDADFVVFSGHKMLGPTGIGILYGKPAILEVMSPFLGGGNMIKAVSKTGFVPADLPHRFEAGTAPIVEAIGLHPAVEYLESLGENTVLKHEQALVHEVHRRLSGLRRIKIFGPAPKAKSGLVTFMIDGMHPTEVGHRLDAAGIAIRVGHHCAMPLHERLGLTSSCRASFYLYNTFEDVRDFCDCIEKLSDIS